jgi:hypothetical protein
MQEILCLRCAYNNLYTELTSYSDKINKRTEDELRTQRKLQNNNTQLIKHISTSNALINTTVLLFRRIVLPRKNTTVNTVCETHVVYISCKDAVLYNMNCSDNLLQSNKI